ncbi:hypothetical protein DYB32_005553 [Aphanomyces invadans]|uniref:SH3 domain-containing protein n=1 Tax=Aphanomyces invadans TaxID=157072 RepID=A0A3R7A854_9STRA|nr:hypothetical protein DYB32_005553 [Aphanomyces invadans]
MTNVRQGQTAQVYLAVLSLVASFITTLVQKELDVLFKSRDENIERLNQQVTALIKDVERITMELESRSAWNRSLTKYEAQLKLAAQDTSPSKNSCLVRPAKRNPFSTCSAADKKLPRVANIDKSNQSFLNALTLQSQKQKIYEQAFVRYPECRSTVFAPSSWDPRNISVQQLELPNMQLKLTRVHGYHSTSNSNVFYLASGELAWFTAKVVVMYSKSRQLQRFYMGHSKEVTAMAMHPNAQIVASGQCGKDSALILVWDSKRVNAEPTHALAKLEGQSVNIRSLSFSHDGKLIASLGGDLYNTICVHDWQDQTLLVKARGHSSKVWTVAFNPYQAYGMPDKTKAQQRVPKRQKWEARPRPGQALRDEDACYTLPGLKEESAFYGSCFGGPNRARQPLPHEKVWKLEGNPPLMKSEAQDFTCLAFTDDNVPLQVYDEATDCIVESPTVTSLPSPTEHSSPPSQQSETTLGRIVAGTAKGDLYVFWQPRRSPSPQQPDLPQKWWELPAASWQLSDDVCLEHVHFESTAKLVEIIPHDVSTGNRFKISRHAQMELQDLQQRLALKPDAKPLLDRLASLEYKGPLAHVNGPCSQIACDVRSGNIATAGGDGKVHIWTLHLLDPMRVCGTRTLGQYTPMHGAASDGRHKMQLERSIQIPSKARLTSLHWSGDGAVVAGLSNHSIWEVDVATGEWSVVVEGCEGSVLGGVLLEDQNELVTVSSDHFIRCWDMGSLLCVKKWPLKSTVLSYPELSEKKALRVLSNESVSVLKFSPDGKYLAVGAKDNCMHVYDATESYKKVAKCEGHATFVSHIDWSIDGYLLQTNSADGEILYWQVHGASVRQITDGMLEGANDVTHQSEESVPDTERNTDDVEVRVPRDEIPAKEEAIREGSTTDGIECGRAKFSFQGEHPDELNLKEGEVIRILEKREGDWWFGNLGTSEVVQIPIRPNMTKYRSTRGDVRNYSFEEAVLSGLASDRGLFVPEENSFPSLPPNALSEWASLSYQDLAVEIMSLFIDPNEIPRRDLEALVKKAYTFGDANYRHKDVAPMVKIKDNLHVLELFHGPTFAFKDIALQFLGHLFEYFLERKNKNSDTVHQVTVIGATSGDTGSSAIYGLRNKKNVEVFILFPNGRVSDIQEQQMTSVIDDSVHNLAVQYNLGAVNSINWARILAQIVYYFYAYFRLPNRDNVVFSVPTGNFGDILAGFYAKKLIVATNDNDILHRFFSTGKYHRTHVNHTTSPSMDICVSSNFERYLFSLCGDDPAVLKEWMTTFESTGKLTVQGTLLKKAQTDMSSYSILEPEVQSTIKQYHVKHDYVLDPHSAIGVAAADHYLESESPNASVVVLATAHYGKFLPTVLDALKEGGAEVEQHPVLQALEKLPRRSFVIENNVFSVKAFVESHVRREEKSTQAGYFSSISQSLLLQGSLLVAVVGVGAFLALKK